MLLAKQILIMNESMNQSINRSVSKSVIRHSLIQSILFTKISYSLAFINQYESYIISNISIKLSLFCTTHNSMKKNDSRCAVSLILNHSLHKTWSWLHVLIPLHSGKELMVPTR